jgi:hypothetical protein
MPRRLSFLAALLLFLILLAALWHFSVFATRTIKDLASSSNGSTSSPAGTCAADSPTPFAAALNGNVTVDSCTDFAGAYTYPNYVLTLQPQDQSFTLTVTPILWENGAGGTGSRETILNLQFSSTNPNLTLQSFVIAGLTVTNGTANPAYVECDFEQAGTSLYELPVATGGTPPVVTACTQPTMTTTSPLVGTFAVQPTPIQFADTNTTRWDIDGLSGSNPLSTPLPSVDLGVAGFPCDLSDPSNTQCDPSGVNVDEGSDTSPTNNLTQTFMATQANFLAVAVNTSSGATETAGALPIPTASEPLNNDSVDSPTIVNPSIAITAGFTDEVNTAAATPLESSTGALVNAPTPADPIPSCATSAVFRTVWYSFTPIGPGTLTVDSANSRYDTVLEMFTGSPGNLIPVAGACDDDVSASILQAKLSNISVAQTQYFIMVGEAPPLIGTLNDSATGNPVVPTTTQAAPLSNDATLFLSVMETPSALPAISLAPPPTTLAFGAQQVGTTSAQQTVTITSGGTAPLTISNISAPSGFMYSAPNCGSSLAIATSCQINITFSPTASGAASGDLTFSDNVTGSSPSYSLTGTGTDFTFPTPSGSAATGTLTATSNATFSLTASGNTGFTGSIAFACSGLPTNTQCSFSPNPAAPGSGTTPIALTVSRISSSRIVTFPKALWKWPPAGSTAIACSMVLLLFGIRITRRRHFKCGYVAVLFLGTAMCIGGCGGGGSTSTTPPVQPTTGSYPFTATATVGTDTKNISLTLDVQ